MAGISVLIAGLLLSLGGGVLSRSRRSRRSVWGATAESFTVLACLSMGHSQIAWFALPTWAVLLAIIGALVGAGFNANQLLPFLDIQGPSADLRLC